jgi:hypothetical protein
MNVQEHLAQEYRKIDKGRCPLTDRVNKNIINTDLGKSSYGTTYHCNPTCIDEDSKPKK